MEESAFEVAMRVGSIPKGSGRHEDYEDAKAIVAYLAHDAVEYEAMILEAAKYVGV